MAASYGWIITADHFAEPGEDGDLGTYEPRNISADIARRLQEGGGRSWRAYDADGELMYSGRYIGPENESMFGPLEDFATPNVGATTIKYKNGRGGWEAL